MKKTIWKIHNLETAYIYDLNFKTFSILNLSKDFDKVFFPRITVNDPYLLG